MARAIVLFQHDSNHPLRHFLKSGFRHCAVAIEAGDYWVLVDPRNGTPKIEVVAGTTFNLAGFYLSYGYTVVETHVVGARLISPFAITNCVGAVKALLGLRNPFVITPYGLFKFLKKGKKP